MNARRSRAAWRESSSRSYADGSPMCGIIGYVGERDCRELILEGLRKLEYRGYDSAGLSLVRSAAWDPAPPVGTLNPLQEAAAPRDGDFDAPTGIGPTRVWPMPVGPSK